MIFDFRARQGKPKNYKYYINEIEYDETIDYGVINSIYYENKYGSLRIQGITIEYADTINLNDAINIEKFKITIDQRLKEMTRAQLGRKPIVIYKFYNCYKELNELMLPSKFKAEKERDTLIIFAEELRDLDISDNNQDMNFDLNENAAFNLSLKNKPGFDIRVKKVFTGEDGKDKSFEIELAEDQINEGMGLVGQGELSQSTDEYEFIDFNDDSKFIIKSYNKVFSEKSTVKEYKKSYFNMAFKPSFTRDGKLVTLGKYNPETNSYKLNICKINPLNKFSKKDAEFYSTNTLPNYLNTISQKLDEMHQNKINLLSIIDHNEIIKNYIIRLEESITHTTNNEIIRRLRREIETLKLFSILFLNPGSPLAERVRIIKKNNLIKWLIQSTEDEFNKELHKYDRIEQILFSMINGRINTSIKLCGNDLNILPLLISQPHNKSSQTLLKESITKWKNSGIWERFPEVQKFIYELLSNNTHSVYSDNSSNIIKYFNWKSIFICLSNYTLNYNSNIIELLNAYEIIQKNTKKVPAENNNHSDINYLLIRLINSIEKSGLGSADLEMISNSESLFSKFSSHHVQYIIISTLLNIINEAYNQSPIEVNVYPIIAKLKKLHFSLVIKCVEELLLNNDWRSAIELVNYSSISIRVKDYIVKDIIFRYPDAFSTDQTFVDYPFAFESLGHHALNNFEIDQAILFYERAGNFSKAFDIFLFYKLYHAIIQNNFTNEMAKKLSEYQAKMRDISRWDSHGKIIQTYYFFLDREYEDEFLESLNCNIADIELLVKEIENMTEELGYTRINLLVKNIMIENIRKIYNKVCLLKSTNDVIYN